VRYAVIERMELPGSWLATARSVAQRQATVYTRAYTPEGGRPRWNVWDTTSGKGRRVELEPWAMGVLSPRSASGVDIASPSEGTEGTEGTA
jgi:hypothetical protein